MKAFISLFLIVTLGAVGMVGAQDDTQPWLGVAIADADDGVAIRSVTPASPAEEAGLEVGDTITALDDQAVTNVEQLISTLQDNYAPDDDVTISIMRDDETLEITVTLGTRPEGLNDEVGQVFTFNADRGLVQIVLGVFGETTDEGFEITNLPPRTESGLQVGDIIVSINGQTLEEFEASAFDAFNEEPLMVEVLREGETITLEVEPVLRPMPFGDFDGEFSFGEFDGQAPFSFFAPSNVTLGVQFETTADGALIVEVLPDTPAAEAELMVDDVVTAVDGIAVDEERTLRDLIDDYEPDDTITLTVQRGDETLDIDVTLVAGNRFIIGGRDFGDGENFRNFRLPDEARELLDNLEDGAFNLVCVDAEGNEVLTAEVNIDGDMSDITTSTFSFQRGGFPTDITCEVNPA